MKVTHQVTYEIRKAEWEGILLKLLPPIDPALGSVTWSLDASLALSATAGSVTEEVLPPPTAVVPAAPASIPIPATPPVSVSPAMAEIIDRKRFDKILSFVIDHEGRTYENNPGDAGGPTKFGIDTKDDRLEWAALGVKDLHDLTLEQAASIYWSKYWLGYICNTFPSPIAETHFNFCVNTGPSRSVKLMQEALGIAEDGQFGPVTKSALEGKDAKAIALGMVNAADNFYRALAQKANQSQFLNGWLNRNNDLRKWIG